MQSEPMRLVDPSSLEEVQSQFELYRYVALKSLINDGLAAMLYGHIKQRIAAQNVRASNEPGMEGRSSSSRAWSCIPPTRSFGCTEKAIASTDIKIGNPVKSA
jgi:hypothetical protein